MESADNGTTSDFPISLQELKRTVSKHVLERFQKELEQNAVDADELSLRDHPYRYKGKLRSPITPGEDRFSLLEKEYGKRAVEEAGPVDTLENSSVHFLLLYRNTLYEGTFVTENRSTLRVLQTPGLQPVVEEIKSKNAPFRGSLWFQSLVIDLDRALKESKRDVKTETEILQKAQQKS